MPRAQVVNPKGAFGLTALDDIDLWTVISDETTNNIAIGEIVSWDATAGTGAGVLRGTSTGPTSVNLVAGFCIGNPIAPAAEGLIVVYGLVRALCIADYASPAAGDILGLPTTTTGRTNKLTVGATTLGSAIGKVIEGDALAAGNTIPRVFVTPM